MTLQDFINETSNIPDKSQYGLLLQVDGFDEVPRKIEIDITNKIIRLLGFYSTPMWDIITLQDFINFTNHIQDKSEYDIVLQVDGLDDDAYFIEIDKSLVLIRIFGF